jgi:outer membrane immunogenic protein
LDGLYVGADIGGVAAKVWTSGPHSNFDDSGLLGGIHAGYNVGFSNGVVAGVEADLANTGIDRTDGPATFKSRWQGSLRARAGYAVDRLLPFVTVGAAISNPLLRGWEGSRPTLVGWTAGGGIEYALDQHWLLRGDMRYSDFGKQDFPFADGMVAKVRLSEVSGTIGLSYKF